MTVLLPLFYLWLAITVLLAAMFLLHRLDLRRLRDDGDRLPHVDHGTGTDPETETEIGTDDEQPAATTEEDEVDTDPDTGEDDVVAQTLTATGEPKAEPDSDQHADADLESDANRADRESDADLESDANRADAEIDAGCPPVMDLLEGATLPNDLAPVTERIAEPERHAILISPNGDAEEVGTAFADELTRLGFTIEPNGHDRATASRDGQVLMLRICPDAGTRGSGAYRRYPTAGATDVAIEIWTGGHSPPRLAD